MRQNPRRSQLLVHLAGFICLAVLLAACSPTRGPRPEGFESADTPADLSTFPQNLEAYVSGNGGDAALMDAESQDRATGRMLSTFFGPWHMRQTSIRVRDVAPAFCNARGYKDDNITWSQAEWDAMRANASLGNFPSRATPGIVLRNTGLRELPTRQPRFTEPTANIKENPFDYFQYSLLHIGTPVLVAHTTLDGLWHYVECPIAGGWVAAGDIAFTDDQFRQEWERGAYVALIRDHVTLPGTGVKGGDSQGGIGVILPRAPGDVAPSGTSVLVPLPGPGGYARTAEVSLAASDYARLPMRLNPANVARVGNGLMGQPYGWGGTNGDRDCSAMIRDLFTPFGLWLPRNSAAQARRGAVVSLEGLSPTEKAAAIMQDGVPFLSLVGMRGHIALYVGVWQGRPAIFHNVWGVRIIKDGNDDERCVIGRAVVTSITPGAELRNLYRPVTFVDRLRTLTRLGR